jgi:hypothetical protein
MPNDLPPDLHSERTRVDTAVYKEIPLGQLSVDANGIISIIRPPSKTDTPADLLQRTLRPDQAG